MKSSMRIEVRLEDVSSLSSSSSPSSSSLSWSSSCESTSPAEDALLARGTGFFFFFFVVVVVALTPVLELTDALLLLVPLFSVDLPIVVEDLSPLLAGNLGGNVDEEEPTPPTLDVVFDDFNPVVVCVDFFRDDVEDPPADLTLLALLFADVRLPAFFAARLERDIDARPSLYSTFHTHPPLQYKTLLWQYKTFLVRVKLKIY